MGPLPHHHTAVQMRDEILGRIPAFPHSRTLALSHGSRSCFSGGRGDEAHSDSAFGFLPPAFRWSLLASAATTTRGRARLSSARRLRVRSPQGRRGEGTQPYHFAGHFLCPDAVCGSANTHPPCPDFLPSDAPSHWPSPDASAGSQKCHPGTPDASSGAPRPHRGSPDASFSSPNTRRGSPYAFFSDPKTHRGTNHPFFGSHKSHIRTPTHLFIIS